jgi:uncharacterized NAD(P)/FAD-binding protein YdhS
MFVVGTLRKPALWESTAVPELRGQAATVAERVLDRLMHYTQTSVPVQEEFSTCTPATAPAQRRRVNRRLVAK